MTGVAFPQAFLIRLLRDLIDKQTWTDEGSVSERMLRSQLLLLACVRKYQPCVQKAEGYFRQWQEADGNLRSVFIEQLACSSEKAMAAHSSTLAWKTPWAEEPGGLQSMGSRGVGRDWATSLSLFTFMHWRRKWRPTPVFLPGESQGRGSLVGCRLWGRRVGHDWSDLAAAAVCSCKGCLFCVPSSWLSVGDKKETSIDQTVLVLFGENIFFFF